VFRAAIECEGCYLVECLERRNECLKRISVEQVVAGCEELLNRIGFDHGATRCQQHQTTGG
jgi:hypothetical protein